MSRKQYPSDLTDQEWAILAPLIPPAREGGRPRSANMREVVNAIQYVLKTGCQWDYLPHEFPAKGTVYHYFNTWRKSGVWEIMNNALYQQVRQAEGREKSPSAAILDSQSVKTSEKGALEAMTVPSR